MSRRKVGPGIGRFAEDFAGQRHSPVRAHITLEQAAARFHARDYNVLVLADRPPAALLRDIFCSNIHYSSAELLLSIYRFLRRGRQGSPPRALPDPAALRCGAG